MKSYFLGIILALAAISAMAQEATASSVPVAESEVSAVSAPVALPPGVITTPNPLKKALLAKKNAEAFLYRPSDNMPDLVNEQILLGEQDTSKVKLSKNWDKLVAYIPKLKVLPCAKGCEGPDYEKAVKQLIAGYSQSSNHIAQRGEFIVQVRWYNTRPWYQRSLPYGEDAFGVSFVIEGKVVSIGDSSGPANSKTSAEIAHELGSSLALQMALVIGSGEKPKFLRKKQPLSPLMATAASAVDVVSTGLSGVASLLGMEDVSSRIEPFTDAHKQLLPAFDGIKPGEINPIKEPQLFGPW